LILIACLPPAFCCLILTFLRLDDKSGVMMFAYLPRDDGMECGIITVFLSRLKKQLIHIAKL